MKEEKQGLFTAVATAKYANISAAQFPGAETLQSRGQDFHQFAQAISQIEEAQANTQQKPRQNEIPAWPFVHSDINTLIKQDDRLQPISIFTNILQQLKQDEYHRKILNNSQYLYDTNK
ncbi:hypothetical protein E2986_11008 [Frieseomelitta varia]|uniref:Uncharacterized protein n=1 Tax=Frieseomelitta varia TaxID=561572 RepID=A0A833S5E4_9HYME|nr:hypothetical protein E2986_11008 [Frieseomelitta varia]